MWSAENLQHSVCLSYRECLSRAMPILGHRPPHPPPFVLELPAGSAEALWGLASQCNFSLCPTLFPPHPATGADYCSLMSLLYPKLSHSICFRRLHCEQRGREQSEECAKKCEAVPVLSASKDSLLDSGSQACTGELFLSPPGCWPQLCSFHYVTLIPGHRQGHMCSPSSL